MVIKTHKCPTCKTINQIDLIQIFDHTFEWFNCSICGDVWVKSRYDEWLESNPYQEYIKKLRPF